MMNWPASVQAYCALTALLQHLVLWLSGESGLQHTEFEGFFHCSNMIQTAHKKGSDPRWGCLSPAHTVGTLRRPAIEKVCLNIDAKNPLEMANVQKKYGILEGTGPPKN